ncbi:MAG: response regulator [Anaerolineae bacterium]
MSRIESVRHLIRPPVFSDAAEKTATAGLLNGVLWVALVGWVLLLGVMPFMPAPLLGLSVIGVVMLLDVVALVMLRRGHVQQVALGLVIALWLVATGSIVGMGTIQTPEVGAFLLILTIAGLLVDLKTAWVVAGSSVLALVGVYLGEGNGWLHPFLPMTPVLNVSLAIANTITAAGFLALVRSRLAQAVARATRNAQEAQENAQALQKVMLSLEAQVTERTRTAELAREEAEKARGAVEQQAWEASALSQLNQVMSGEQELPALAAQVIRQLCRDLNCQMGALFLLDEGVLRLVGAYAYPYRKNLSNQFRPGEGLVGQAALEKQLIVLRDVPPDYIAIRSGLIQASPRHVLAIPFTFDSHVVGVVELATLTEFTPAQSAYLDKALQSVAVGFNTAQSRARIDALLLQTQQQARDLKRREEELRGMNAELAQQTQALTVSQQQLRAQQKALETTNVDLVEKAGILQEQRATLDRQNRDLVLAQQALERKAEELALASKYKSEFLANMSHELRTPLNSLLILAQMLADNDEGNLSVEQIESARIIYNSGNDLLALINEILDLAKVESGRMQFHFEPVQIASLVEALHAQFDHVAAERSLAFEVAVSENLPSGFVTDQQRLLQVLKNLLANSFKFTPAGSVRVVVERPAANADLGPIRVPPTEAIALRVVDTGIGMTPEQQKIVFEAFQQADGSTSRKYGGTGLGLTISREMVARLGGKIELQSEHGQGSTFTLYLPERQPAAGEAVAPAVEPAPSLAPAPAPASVPAATLQAAADDRDSLKPGDRVLLIIEDDLAFARAIYDYAHKKDFKCIIGGDGETGLALVQVYRPDAVVLDLRLPGMSGWEVLEQLKHDPATRHIPVHILSAESENLDAYKMGAVGFLTKPVTAQDLDGLFGKITHLVAHDIKNLLIVEDDAGLRRGIRQLLGGSDVRVTETDLGQTAIDLLRARVFDCMILDLRLPDMTGMELLNRINGDPTINRCPIIVYTGQELTEDQNAELVKYADSVIIKGAKSPERLLDETALFLHRVVSEMSPENQQAIKGLYDQDAGFVGKHILVVDDDMRNAFALSRLLGAKGFKVSLARSGQKGIDQLDATSKIDLVLMDIMMPEMDGYETMRRIRAQPRLRTLPILAITAKAMPGDRDKCIEAGASDYLAKPIDPERLFSMLRVWLYR